jgi:hypothetical protein
MVFTSVLGLSRVKPAVRLTILVCLVLYTIAHGYWHTSLFVTGTILAELRLIREESEEDLKGLTSFPRHASIPGYVLSKLPQR